MRLLQSSKNDYIHKKLIETCLGMGNSTLQRNASH